jgi:hypothetical protein
VAPPQAQEVLAHVRVEGIAATKFTGILVLLPAIAWLRLLTDWKQWLLAFVPGFWPTKAIQSLGLTASQTPLEFSAYIAVGFLWCFLATVASFILFRRTPSAEG